MAEATGETVKTTKVTLTMTGDEARLLMALIDIPLWGRLGKHASDAEAIYDALFEVAGYGHLVVAEHFFGMKRKELIK